ncbi:hypothetical protein BO86DRAFT_374603 [Aspergillus japonicus CBS 114.51]|uniref:Uncharacterized protein n=1 Tax=Aspergillus japonicus CBS 114.51 TaxID=1448312 RepID=A0A8T8XH69_ASPJA|nr:hypothetical protein BO86DRAFT_374603 [Aspergillus japonicus CBS 114.51]RAH87606.1 hypothetical protein BO86DRAFT_374603 [Aspergillus japonicus CBS 114.51]
MESQNPLPINGPPKGETTSGTADKKDDYESPVNLSKDNIIDIMKAIVESDQQNITLAIEKALPDGADVDAKQLREKIHPDKHILNDEHRKLATEASQRLNEAIQRAEGGDIRFRFGGGGLKPESSDLTRKSYHISAYRKAYNSLLILCEAACLNPDIQISKPSPDPGYRLPRAGIEAYNDLKEINNEIMKQNRNNNFEANTGLIDVPGLVAKWKAIHIAYMNSRYPMKVMQSNLDMFIDNNQYPSEWKKLYSKSWQHFGEFQALWNTLPKLVGEYFTNSLSSTPPSSKRFCARIEKILDSKSNKLDKKYKRGTSLFSMTFDIKEYITIFDEVINAFRKGDLQTYIAKREEIQVMVKEKAYPVGLVPPSPEQAQNWQPSSNVPGMGDHGSPILNSGFAANQAGNPSQVVRGNNGAFAIKARVVGGSFKPGYTSLGERIRFIQRRGAYCANFVVEDDNQMWRLVDSGYHGGRSAVEQAEGLGVPSVVQDVIEIRNLRDRVAEGGDWGIFFAAAGKLPINSIKPRLPDIVVGFYHIDPAKGEMRNAVSRSNLGQILRSKSTADKLIAELISGISDMRLQDVLMPQQIPSLLLPPHTSQTHQFNPINNYNRGIGHGIFKNNMLNGYGQPYIGMGELSRAEQSSFFNGGRETQMMSVQQHNQILQSAIQELMHQQQKSAVFREEEEEEEDQEEEEEEEEL